MTKARRDDCLLFDYAPKYFDFTKYNLAQRFCILPMTHSGGRRSSDARKVTAPDKPVRQDHCRRAATLGWGTFTCEDSVALLSQVQLAIKLRPSPCINAPLFHASVIHHLTHRPPKFAEFRGFCVRHAPKCTKTHHFFDFSWVRHCDGGQTIVVKIDTMLSYMTVRIKKERPKCTILHQNGQNAPCFRILVLDCPSKRDGSPVVQRRTAGWRLKPPPRLLGFLFAASPCRRS